MQALIVGFLNFLSSCIDTIFPDLSMNSSLGSNVSSAVSTVLDFIKSVNFIVPINDILLMIGIVMAIKLFKIGIFIVNWVIDKIEAVIP